ncbi:MAG: hydroxylamine reductase [Bacteriovoracaceae bacterium]|nr:hydroxylamine reductase [Bacteriovoracaceae bacterium]
MGMFCYQCQEAVGGVGCKVAGACGKVESTSNLQDLLVFMLRGISLYQEAAIEKNGKGSREADIFVTESLFATITNANFDDEDFITRIKGAIILRDKLKAEYGSLVNSSYDALTWSTENVQEFHAKAAEVGVQSIENEDVRSLRELAIYGLKGIAAYAHHAYVIAKENQEVFNQMHTTLASTTRELSLEDMIAVVMKTGELAVSTMALLDEANTSTYGNPELSEVNIGVGTNPGILISGHDLKDIEQLLEQTKGTGVDVYTHSEMLPAHYYPKFKQHEHLRGNYGGAWWTQAKEFETFNGPIVMTTNCIVPVKDSYRNRIYTTGVVGYPGVARVAEAGEKKDFTAIIEQAKKCAAPIEIETGKIVGGFAHSQVMALADKVVDAVKSGAIKKFIVMAGCDGRQKGRNYYTDLAESLPKDTVILTAGCAKFRYNKLELGDIGGIPRVLDAGQCNDSYSLAVIALKLKEVFGLDDINDLPIEYDIAWYEQKAVTVLLALLHLGVKGIRLGPTLPAFLSPNVVKVLVENFNIKPIGTVEEDLADMMK